MKEKILSLRVKLGFGVCDLGGNLFFTMMGFHLLFFLTDIAGLGAGLAGTALMIGKIWDAVTDPAVGVLSDRTQHRWGRRRPYIFYGAVLLFATMILMFVNPQIPRQGLLFVWAAFAYCLVNTAYTLVNIPYSAMLPELTTDFNQRTLLTAYRMSFAVVGTFIGAGAVRPLAGSFVSLNTGWLVMGAVMGAVMMITALATFFAIREPSDRPVVVHEKVFRSFLDAMKTRAFLLSVFPWLLHVTGTTIIQGALVYYFRYIYGAEEQFEIALLFLLGSVFIFIPVWTVVSRRIGKKLSYNLGMLLFAVVVIVFFLFAPKLGITFSYVIMALAGVGVATHNLMPHPKHTDVGEYGDRHPAGRHLLRPVDLQQQGGPGPGAGAERLDPRRLRLRGRQGSDRHGETRHPAAHRSHPRRLLRGGHHRALLLPDNPQDVRRDHRQDREPDAGRTGRGAGRRLEEARRG